MSTHKDVSRLYLYVMLISLIISAASSLTVQVLFLTEILSIRYGNPSFRIAKVWYHRTLRTVEFYIENNGTADAHDVEVEVNGYTQRVGTILKGDVKFVWLSLETANVDWDSPRFRITVKCREGVSKSFTFG